MRKQMSLAFAMLLSVSVLSQQIKQEKGITTIEYKLPEGTVRVYLPSDIRAGDVISGSITLEPGGSNARQRQRSLEQLLEKQIKIGDPSTSPVILQNAYVPAQSGAVFAHIKVPVQFSVQFGGTNAVNIPLTPFEEQGNTGCMVPTHMNTGAPLRIPGAFDGDATNTRVTISDRTLHVLAESPRALIVRVPDEAKGPGTMTIEENGQKKCEAPVRGVSMELSAGKLDLMRGERTYISVTIRGLENLPAPANLTLDNLTLDVVTLTSGNKQLIPIAPDSAGGTWTRTFDVQSIRTGTFAVNVNLDLPEVYSTANQTVPPGYTRKTCECSATATITRTGGTDNTGFFKVQGNPQCTGAHGIGINTFERCRVAGVSYKWEIASGKENANIDGGNTGETATVRSSVNASYVVCVTMTVTCIDGTTCTQTVCANQTGERTENPGGTTTRPPSEPEKPPVRSKCDCSASASITRAGIVGGMYTYNVVVKAACTGVSGTGNTVVKCAVSSITYNWSISSGKEIAAIPGKADGTSVGVKVTGTGMFVLNVNGTVTCSDGTTCDFYANIEEIITVTPPAKACNLLLEEKMEPLMDGGLKEKFKMKKAIKRDDFIALGAEGKDIDQLKWTCEPTSECRDTRSEKVISLNGRVKFTWEITGGEGGFVKLGCLPDLVQTDEGDNVIFKPPFVPLPVKAADTSITTTIKLTIIDDNPTQPADPSKERTIIIITKRTKAKPDEYSVEVTSDKYTLPTFTPPPPVTGTCKTQGPTWTMKDELTKPVISLPAVADNDKMVLGQWIVLTTNDQRDNDKATFTCVSQTECPTTPTDRTYEDNVKWEWTKVGGGRFVSDPSGRFIIYEAPLEMPSNKSMLEIKIRVQVKNGESPKVADREPQEGEIVLKIYQGGVKISHPPVTWLPEEDNSVSLTSSLMYRDGDWQPALAHMCRIQYFELMVSSEKGVAMNDPVPKDANECRDMKFKNEAAHEAFDDKENSKCKVKEQFRQARTQQPVKEYTIDVHSLDFGGYGFTRSFANVNKGGKDSIKGEKPVYISIPVKATDVTHPLGRAKKRVYGDNRVTVPHDIDENRICDNGWTATGGARLNDPVSNNVDEDGTPDGDGYDGDGLTTYEEYRGFKIVDAGTVDHTRTSYDLKDIFVRNRDGLNINLYTTVSELGVHEINEDQYVSDKIRVVNANSNPSTHLVNQMGLNLIDAGDHGSLLGIAVSTTNQPTIPNQELEIRVYSGKIATVCTRKNLVYADKIAAVVAHELLHGNNVCHHGEGDETMENQFDRVHGLRSGNVSCVMRYDNVGNAIPGFVPEAIGSSLCTSAAGTGYNANNMRFRDAATKRGNCKGQIRISGRAATAPKSCGNR